MVEFQEVILATTLAQVQSVRFVPAAALTSRSAAPLPALPHLDHDWPRLRFQPAAGGAFHSGSPLIMLAGQASTFWD
jgi:hypothetical protein